MTVGAHNTEARLRLLERDDELEVLTEVIDAAAIGEGSLTVVKGVAVTGKSALLASSSTMWPR